jgi:hypothetical protein
VSFFWEKQESYVWTLWSCSLELREPRAGNLYSSLLFLLLLPTYSYYYMHINSCFQVANLLLLLNADQFLLPGSVKWSNEPRDRCYRATNWNHTFHWQLRHMKIYVLLWHGVIIIPLCMEISFYTVFPNILYLQHTWLPLMGSHYFVKAEPRLVTLYPVQRQEWHTWKPEHKILQLMLTLPCPKSSDLSSNWILVQIIDIHSILGGIEATWKKTYILCVRQQTQIVLCFIRQLGNYNVWFL